jgi:hypothetical protein
MAGTGIRRPEPVQVKGLAAKGAISCPGASVGNAVFGMINVSSGANETANFESTISAAGQIQQTSSSNLSANEYWSYFVG